jgi:hypothetical protein
MFDPIAGHGQANAALMTSAGLAWLAGSPAALTGTIRGLALVQPLLVCDLLFAVLISVMLRHRRPDGITVAGVLGSAAGLACFVAVAGPSGGVTTVSFPSVLPLIVALGAVLIGCLTAARLNPWGTRAIWLALACGACFGVTAFLLKLVPGTLLQGSATRSGSGRCTSWSSSGLSGSCSTRTHFRPASSSRLSWPSSPPRTRCFRSASRTYGCTRRSPPRQWTSPPRACRWPS